MRLIIILFLLTVSTVYATDQFSWKDRDGNPVPNTDSMKSVQGFGGWLVVTPDLDWQEKWNTPAETTPNFSEAFEVSLGEQLTILTFFGNPAVSADGEIEILCDLQVVRPDKSYSVNEKDIECAKGALQGNPYNVRLSQAIIKYVGEPGDQIGEWSVFVTLKDKLRKVEAVVAY
jgi:hypothetical protein